MSTTRAMRHLAPDPVPDELIHSLLEAATWAPTLGNSQTEAFVVVTDRGQMARLATLWRRVIADCELLTDAAFPGYYSDPAAARIREATHHQRDHFAETPAVIVVCVDQRAAKRRARAPFDR